MKKRKVLRVVLVLMGVVILGFAAFLFMGLNTKNASIKNIDIAGVPDGTYLGAYSAGRFSNELEVTVSGGKITGVVIVKDVAIAVPDVSARVFQAVIDRQTLGIDTVSGATATTRAYLKAMEDALYNK